MFQFRHNCHIPVLRVGWGGGSGETAAEEQGLGVWVAAHEVTEEFGGVF
jgi:hypothetical protein